VIGENSRHGAHPEHQENCAWQQMMPERPGYRGPRTSHIVEGFLWYEISDPPKTRNEAEEAEDSKAEGEPYHRVMLGQPSVRAALPQRLPDGPTRRTERDDDRGPGPGYFPVGGWKGKYQKGTHDEQFYEGYANHSRPRPQGVVRSGQRLTRTPSHTNEGHYDSNENPLMVNGKQHLTIPYGLSRPYGLKSQYEADHAAYNPGHAW